MKLLDKMRDIDDKFFMRTPPPDTYNNHSINDGNNTSSDNDNKNISKEPLTRGKRIRKTLIEMLVILLVGLILAFAAKKMNLSNTYTDTVNNFVNNNIRDKAYEDFSNEDLSNFIVDESSDSVGGEE